MIIENIKEQISNKAKWILEDNIVSFWVSHSMDLKNGGFWGWIDDGNQIRKDADKGLVMTARILWSFSALYSFSPKQGYKQIADHALRFLLDHLKDKKRGGYYWLCDFRGNPKVLEKIVYGQAFVLYGLNRYLENWPDQVLEEEADELFNLLETNSRDGDFNGYYEACTENWVPLEDHNLGDEDIRCAKSMNTHLHLLEAYAQHYKRKRDALPVRESLLNLISLHFNRIQDPETGHLSLYFNRDWTRMDKIRSFGHDIEASWLIWEALEVLENRDLIERYRHRVMSLLDVSLNGLRMIFQTSESDSSQSYMVNEFADGYLDEKRMWWVQAETLVGLVNAWEISGREEYLRKAENVLNYIAGRQINPSGEWFWALDNSNNPISGFPKGGIWKTPYHNSRACLEILRRMNNYNEERKDEKYACRI